MSKVMMRKDLAGLRPLDQMAADKLAKLKVGDVVAVDFAKPRNVKFHRWYWALMTIVANNMPGEIDPETVSDVIKIRAGHVQVVRTARGEVFLPRSISFAKMDETAFREFVDRAIRVIVTDILPGVKSDDLRAEVENMLSGGM